MLFWKKEALNFSILVLLWELEMRLPTLLSRQWIVYELFKKGQVSRTWKIMSCTPSINYIKDLKL